MRFSTLLKIKILCQISFFLMLTIAGAIFAYTLYPKVHDSADNIKTITGDLAKSSNKIEPTLKDINDLSSRFNKHIDDEFLTNTRNYLYLSTDNLHTVSNHYGRTAIATTDFLNSTRANVDTVTVSINKSLANLDAKLDRLASDTSKVLGSSNQVINSVNDTFPRLNDSLDKFAILQGSLNNTIMTTNAKLPAFFDAHTRLAEKGGDTLEQTSIFIKRINTPRTLKEKITASAIQFVIGSGAGVLRR